MKKEKVVFITGATGFVGSYVTRELLTRGYEVIALVRGENAEYRLSRILSQVYGNPGEYDELKRKLQVIRGDIVNDNLGISPQDSDDLRQRRCRVIHCAASVSFSETERSRIEEQNIVGTKNTLKFMRMLDLRELHYI
nr:SDR family oxidoreductase [Candidatus Omnitrophota bacterium]